MKIRNNNTDKQTWNKRKTVHNPKIWAIFLTKKMRELFVLLQQKFSKQNLLSQQVCKQGNIFIDIPL